MSKRLSLTNERENMLKLTRKWLASAAPHEKPHYEATIKRLEVLIARDKARRESR